MAGSSAKRPKSKGVASRLSSHDFAGEEDNFNWLINSVKGSHFKGKKHSNLKAIIMREGDESNVNFPQAFAQNFQSFDQPEFSALVSERGLINKSAR